MRGAARPPLGNRMVVPVIEIITGADAFNYFFSVVLFFGLFAFGVNLLVRILTRS